MSTASRAAVVRRAALESIDPVPDDDGPLYRLADYCKRCGKLDQEGAHKRYYCPRCHEVTCGMKRHGVYIALPHYRSDPDGSRTNRPLCRGGEVDPKEDRAP